MAPGGQADDPKGLFWILDEEVLIPGSGDSVVLDRLCSYFAAKGAQKEGKGERRSVCPFHLCCRMSPRRG